MTITDKRRLFEPTSADGAMVKQARKTVIVGCMLVGLGTSTAVASPMSEALRSQRAMEQTTSGAPIFVSEAANVSIGELRRLSGLTWDQLARLFKVSRRSLHFWASGKPMTSSNEAQLQRLLQLVRKLDHGSASANRAALFRIREDGVALFDLLVAGAYEQVLSLLGASHPVSARPPKPAAATLAARAPRPPEELVGALQDRVHHDRGPVRAAKSVRIRSER